MEKEELKKVQRLLVTASDILRNKYGYLSTDEIILFSKITDARAQLLEIIWKED